PHQGGGLGPAIIARPSGDGENGKGAAVPVERRPGRDQQKHHSQKDFPNHGISMAVGATLRPAGFSRQPRKIRLLTVILGLISPSVAHSFPASPETAPETVCAVVAQLGPRLRGGSPEANNGEDEDGRAVKRAPGRAPEKGSDVLPKGSVCS